MKGTHPMRAILAVAAVISVLGMLHVGNGERQDAGVRPVVEGVVDLPTTFLPLTKSEPSLRQVFGLWTQIAGTTQLLLAPRTPNPSNPRTTVQVFGSIPSGTYEGVLDLELVPNVSSNVAPRLIGRHVSASSRLQSRSAVAVMRAEGRLELALNDAAPLEFVRTGDVRQALSAVAIIGHRGLSLGQQSLMNTALAFDHAFLFGCTGVEFDVTVPFELSHGRKIARSDTLRVLHPPEIWSEVSGNDSVALGESVDAPSVPAVLDLAGKTGIRLVYVDPKLRWLYPERRSDAVRALENLVAGGRKFIEKYPGTMLMIGAERSDAGETAEILGGVLAGESADRRLVWALEFTRGSDIKRYQSYVAGLAGGAEPRVLSWNLLRIAGAGQGILGFFLRDVPAEDERWFAGRSQASIFWTAASESQFRSALAAAKRIGLREAVGRTRTAIITPYPHRLAFFLAGQAE